MIGVRLYRQAVCTVSLGYHVVGEAFQLIKADGGRGELPLPCPCACADNTMTVEDGFYFFYRIIHDDRDIFGLIYFCSCTNDDGAGLGKLPCECVHQGRLTAAAYKRR